MTSSIDPVILVPMNNLGTPTATNGSTPTPADGNASSPNLVMQSAQLQNSAPCTGSSASTALGNDHLTENIHSTASRSVTSSLSSQAIVSSEPAAIPKMDPKKPISSAELFGSKTKPKQPGWIGKKWTKCKLGCSGGWQKCKERCSDCCSDCQCEVSFSMGVDF
ncbi:uncharacterized protein I206_104631 [Kwoniella pini CBS 10737]|uniref:Uncharacterized protein n=1 Tax=Kwoniella pini CBS 10737 TaxID=1296096 RepID=A0A1B9I7F6_9TREE|nr:uncharacterized protein I206_02167 [Kwoniella pini CBS 10737]OCF51453.1 hypothetical protein I206_02167 [Kwoniella pini CBS 10737]